MKYDKFTEKLRIITDKNEISSYIYEINLRSLFGKYVKSSANVRILEIFIKLIRKNSDYA